MTPLARPIATSPPSTQAASVSMKMRARLKASSSASRMDIEKAPTRSRCCPGLSHRPSIIGSVESVAHEIDVGRRRRAPSRSSLACAGRPDAASARGEAARALGVAVPHRDRTSAAARSHGRGRDRARARRRRRRAGALRRSARDGAPRAPRRRRCARASAAFRRSPRASRRCGPTAGHRGPMTAGRPRAALPGKTLTILAPR